MPPLLPVPILPLAVASSLLLALVHSQVPALVANPGAAPLLADRLEVSRPVLRHPLPAVRIGPLLATAVGQVLS
ncbi:MAG: hypothetical protein ACYSWU_12465 [Planctomycetota bacterium]